MLRVNELVVDTSIWIEFFRGRPLPALEEALGQGAVVLPPIVAAELMSAPLRARERAALSDLLDDLPLCPTPIAHWKAVGRLRARCSGLGLSISTPDAHVAQCAIELGATLWTLDAIFAKLAERKLLRLFKTRLAR